MRGQLMSVDLLIGVLAAVAVFSIGVAYFDSIATRQVHSNNAIDASNIILQTMQAPQGTCYNETLLDGTAIAGADTCAHFNPDACKSVYVAKRFTLINFTDVSCNEGCILLVKTCAG